MSQYDFAPLDADTDDGTKLVAALNSWVPSVVTQHAGTTRPLYARQGMLWVDNSASPELAVNLFDGTLDREIARVSSTGIVLSGEQAAVWSEIIPGHDFAPGIAVYHNGTAWARAKADAEATAARAIVRSVSGTKVAFQQMGLIDSLTGLTPGGVYYLSASTAGQITTTRPTTGFAQVILAAMTATRGIVAVSPVQAVDGMVLLRPGAGQNVVSGKDADTIPLQIRRRADQRANLLTIEAANGDVLGAISKDGLFTGTLAPPTIVPPGAFMHWFGNVAPSGWILADGGAIPSQYTTLRAMFGTNMPDFRGRFIIASHPNFATGTGGGAYSAAIGAANLPNGVQIVTNVNWSSVSRTPSLAIAGSADGGGADLNVSAFRGSSTPISIIPPYVSLTLICKAG